MTSRLNRWMRAREDWNVETEEGAARAFDRAMVAAHGNLCTINFNHSDYERELLTFHEAQLRKLEDGRGK